MATIPTKDWTTRWNHNGILFLLGCLALVFVHSAQARVWTSRADMPTPRGYLGASAVDGQIYLFGGSVDESADDPATTLVEVYDPASDSWSRKADLPMPRTVAAAAAIDGKIYIIGTRGFGDTEQEFLVYDPASDSWSQKADLPIPRGSGLAAVDGKLYTIGGRDPSLEGGIGTPSVLMYDPASDSWSQKADMPELSIWLLDGAAAIDGKIYVMGISRKLISGLRQEVYMYDPASDSWSQKANIPTPRMALATAVVDGKIYAIGGGNQGYAGNALVEVYDPATDTWSTEDVPALKNARAGAAAVAVGGTIYVFGGWARLSVSWASVEAFDPSHPVIDSVTDGFSTTIGAPSLPLHFGIQLELPADSKAPDLSLDLAAYGQNTPVALTHQGGGRYTGQASVEPPALTGHYRLPLLLSAEGAAPEPFLDLQLSVFPAGDAMIFSQALDPAWSLEPNARVTLTTAEIDGRPGLAFDPAGSWRVDGLTSVPVDFFGFEALSLAFHPGTATITEGRSPRLRLQTQPGRLLDILDRIDLANPTWQRVVFTLEDLGVDGSLPLEGLAFNGGNLEGTFYLGDIRLVAQEPPPNPEPPTTAVLEHHQSGTPDDFGLEQNYPNPFNSATVIRFALPQARSIELSVYNLAGQQVIKLIDGPRSAGSYTIHWDGRDQAGRELASGLYFYRLQAGSQIETHKLLLLR